MSVCFELLVTVIRKEIKAYEFSILTTNKLGKRWRRERKKNRKGLREATLQGRTQLANPQQILCQEAKFQLVEFHIESPKDRTFQQGPSSNQDLE